MFKKIFSLLGFKSPKTVAGSDYQLPVSTHDDISFREGYFLTDLPVCIFFQGDKRLTFLLDTGSSHSIIDSNILDNVEHAITTEKGNVTGLEGIETLTDICNIKLEYKNKEYGSDFLVKDMKKVFDDIKKETGVTLHGLLGSDFFRLFQFVIDFDSLVAYSKMTLQKQK